MLKGQKWAFLYNFETFEDIWIQFYGVKAEISFYNSTKAQGILVTGKTV